MSDYIRVTDRRGGGWYAVSNSILDEWFPLIEKPGYLLYTFYIRMARIENGNERSSPGYRLMSEHFKMGRGTISEYNNLLVWCRLIEIDAGDRERPNEYIILPTPSVTPAALADIEAAARFHLEQLQARQDDEIRRLERGGLPKEADKLRRKGVGGKFYTTLFQRLENWQPMPWVEVPWQKGSGGETAVSQIHPAQLSLLGGSTTEPRGSVVERGGSVVERGGSVVERGGSVVERGGSVVERGGSGSEPDQDRTKTYTDQDLINKTYTTRGGNGDDGVLVPNILSWIGFNGRLKKGVDKDGTPYDETWVTPEILLAWAFWVKADQKNHGGRSIHFLRGHLRSNTLPHGYLQDIARVWLGLDDYEKWDLLESTWSARNTELWFSSRSMPTGVARKFLELHAATGGNVAPPLLMPAPNTKPRHPKPAEMVDDEPADLPQPVEWLYIVEQVCAVEKVLGTWLRGAGLRIFDDQASIVVANDYAVRHIERVLPRIKAMAAQMGEPWAQRLDVKLIHHEEEMAYAD